MNTSTNKASAAVRARSAQPKPSRRRTTWLATLGCAALMFALAPTASADTAALGVAAVLEGPTAGSDSVVLAVSPETAVWTATTNAPWLHLTSGFDSGTGSTNVLFTFDANPGATRTGTLTIAGQTLTVTQAGSTHVAASAVTTLVGSGLSSPTSLAVDGAGNVYLADRNSSTIKKWTMANNTTTTLVASGLSLPNAVAVDGAGNVYIADSGNAAIKKWTATNGIVSPLVATGLTNPYGVAVDGAGHVYIADSGNNAVKKWSVTDSNVTTLVSSGLNQPIGLAVDAAGNVYIADAFNNAIKKWTAANSNVTTLVSSGLSTPAGVAVDGAGNVYIANTFGHSIRKWTAANSTVTTLVSSGLFQPNGVAVSGAGHVYIANTGNNSIRELPRALVDTATRLVGPPAGSDALPVVLPTAVNLLAPFAPTSNQPWLTISSASNGVVSVNFTANTNSSRTANLTVLGQIVPVTQTGPTFSLATNASLVGHTAGGDSVGLVTTPEGAPWTATNNVPWLHLASGFASGTGSTNVSFTFDANPGAVRIGTLTIAGQTLTVTQAALPLPEIGVQQPGGTNLTDGTATNDFGSGYVSFPNTIKTFVITNSGNTNLTGLVSTIDGAHPGDFIVSAIAGTNLPANASATFNVTFAPTAVGSRSAAIHIANNDPDENPFDIALTGFGVAPSYLLGTATKSVGYPAGSDSVALTVTPEIATWTATANVSWLHLASGFTNGTGSTNVSFTFDANPGAIRIGTLTIAGQTLTVTQAALPLPEIGVQQPGGTNLTDGAATSDFGPGLILATNLTRTFVITNSGTTNLTGLAITKDGAHPADFIVGALGSINLAANASTTFTVSFAPTTIGNRSAAIHIASNDSDENPFDINLTGNGVMPTYALAASTRWLGPTAGTDSIMLAATPTNATWTATANAPWLHLSLGNQSGMGSTNVVFTFDANSGPTRTGTLTLAGQTLTVTQAGTGYVLAGVVTPLATNGFTIPYEVAVDAAGNVYIADTENHAIKKWTLTNNAVTPLVTAGLNLPYGVAADAAGNVYIADTANSAIKKWNAANNTVTTLVATGLNFPYGVAVDGSGNLYIADTGNNAIKKWTATNSIVTTLVDAGLVSPFGVAVDAAGNVYIADTINNAIKKWTAGNSAVTTLVASGLNSPYGLAVDAAGNVFIADSENHAIKKWTAANSTVTTVVGSGLNSPFGVAVDAAGSLYLADSGNSAIKEMPRAFVNPTAKAVGFAAGSDTLPVVLPASVNLRTPFTPTSNQPWLTIGGVTNGVVSFNFTANPGPARAANLSLLGQTIIVNQAALLYTASLGLTNRVVGPTAGSDSVVLSLIPLISSNWTATANAPWLHLSAPNQNGTGSTNVVFTFDANPDATRTGTLTIAGQTLSVTQAGANYTNAGVVTPLVATALSLPHGVAVDGAGNVYLADTYNSAVKKWTMSNNTVTTLVSTGLSLPFGVAVDGAGNVYIADTYNHAIKKWNVAGGNVTTVVGSGLNFPMSVAVDGSNNVYIADRSNYAIKQWLAASNTVTTLVNSGLNLPNGVAVDAAGNVYIADTYNGLVKKWTAANNTVTTLVASGLNLPMSVAVDGSGNVYIADRNNYAIKKWSVTSNTVTSLVASGLNLPNSVAVDGAGNVYFADTFNQIIKELPRAFVDPTAQTVGNAAGSSSLPTVLPTTANLLPPFTPTSSQPWLTISGSSNGVVGFAVTANAGASRSANLTVLGRTILVTQTLVVTSPLLSYAVVPAGLALSFAANPGQLYLIESAPAVTGPWITNATLTGPFSGILNHTNPISTVGNRFFRTRTP